MTLESSGIYNPLILVGSLTPIALYFLSLGIVNSTPKPRLVSARTDFLMLTAAAAPIPLMWSAPIILTQQVPFLAIGACVLLAAIFARLLPAANSGFVIYNISPEQWRPLVEPVLQRLGFRRISFDGTDWEHGECGVQLKMSRMQALRNSSIHIEGPVSERKKIAELLASELPGRLNEIEQLPSIVGMALVLTGSAMMLLPMWIASRPGRELADALVNLFG